MTIEEYNLSSDKPLNDIEQDVLGYSKFATNLARCITAGTFDDGIVFSLYAEWGAGKSTTLSFLESEIKIKHLILKYCTLILGGFQVRMHY